MNMLKQSNAVAANISGAMEQRPFQKRENLKSHTSKGNLYTNRIDEYSVCMSEL
jgi:hypothetical protein